MRCLRLSLGAVAFLFLAASPAAAVSPDDGGAKCKRYEIVGIRGSGESVASPYGMNTTVGEAAEALAEVLGPRRVRTYSLPYPAAPVTDLLRDGGSPFYRSMALGRVLLTRRVREVSEDCPRTRTAVIGYSQGAAVASEALRRMSRRERRNVRALVLFADPWSDGETSYAMTLKPDGSGEPATRVGGGALGKRRSAIPARTLDVCFAGDLVCDLSSSSVEVLVQAALSVIHSGYSSCCLAFPLEIPLAHWAADKLRGPGRIVPQKSIAGVKLRMTDEQVVSIVGQPDRKRLHTHPIFGTSTVASYRAAGISVVFGSPSGTVTSVSTTSSKLRTARDVGVGSTRRTVRKRVNGVRCETLWRGWRSCYVGSYRAGTVVTDFRLNEHGRVRRVTIGYVVD